MSGENPDDRKEARRRDDAAIRLEQKFKDFLDLYDIDKKASALWREKIEEKVAILDRLDTPFKVLGGAIVLMATPVLGIFGWDLGRWLVHKADILFK